MNPEVLSYLLEAAGVMIGALKRQVAELQGEIGAVKGAAEREQARRMAAGNDGDPTDEPAAAHDEAAPTDA